MKRKIISGFGIILLAVLAMGVTSCKKDKNKNVDTASMQQLVADENKMAMSDDDAMNDVNNVLSLDEVAVLANIGQLDVPLEPA